MSKLSPFSKGLLLFFALNLIPRALFLGYQGDEGEYLVQSMLVSRGQTPIVDFFVFNNQVNFYYFYGLFIRLLGHHFWAIRLVSAAVSLATILVMLHTLETLLPNSPRKKLWLALPVIGFYASTIFFPYTVMILHILPAIFSLACMSSSLLFLERALRQGRHREIFFLSFTSWFFFSAAFFFRSLVLFAGIPLLAYFFFFSLGPRLHNRRERFICGIASCLGGILPALPSLYILTQAPQAFFFNLFKIRMLFQQSNSAGTWTTHLIQNLKEFIFGWPWVDLFVRFPLWLKVSALLQCLPELLLLGLIILSIGAVRRRNVSRDMWKNPAFLVLAGGAILIAGFIFCQKFQNLGYYAPALFLFYCAVPFLLEQGSSHAGNPAALPLIRWHKNAWCAIGLLMIRFMVHNIGSVVFSRNPRSSRSPQTLSRITETVRPHVKPGDLILEYEGLTTFLLDLTPPAGFAQMAGTRALWLIFSEEEMARHRAFSLQEAERRIRAGQFSAVIIPEAVIEPLDHRLLEILRQKYKLYLSLNGTSVFLPPDEKPAQSGASLPRHSG